MYSDQAVARREEYLLRSQELAEAERDGPYFVWYLPIVLVALLKDLLDFAIGWIPPIGFVLAVCFGIIIFALLSFVKTNKALIESRFLIKKLLRRLIPIILAMILESLPIFNLAPIETITVLVIYWLDKHMTDKQLKILSEALKKMR